MHFECHITCNQSDAEKATNVAKGLHWKTSEIARDPVLGQATYFYLTSHGATYQDLFNRMKLAVSALTECGVVVVREKIEQILFDTKLKLEPGNLATVPVKPTRGMLISMALRFDHAFGLDRDPQSTTFPYDGYTPAERESTLRLMEQVHEEVVGAGFYAPDKEQYYTDMVPTPANKG